MTTGGTPPDHPRPSVFLVEASTDARTLVRNHLEASLQVRIVGAASTLPAAARRIATHAPDVVIVDDLADLQTGILQTGILQPSEPRVVLHATTVPAASLEELGQAGVHEVVFKEVGMLDELVAAVARAAAREVHRK